MTYGYWKDIQNIIYDLDDDDPMIYVTVWYHIPLKKL
jgi:hypothetical protein